MGSLKENLNNMDQINGNFVSATCPFSGESVELKVDDSNTKPVKTNLRIKVPLPIKLKHHVNLDENFDTLHSRTEEVTSLVSVLDYMITLEKPIQVHINKVYCTCKLPRNNVSFNPFQLTLSALFNLANDCIQSLSS